MAISVDVLTEFAMQMPSGHILSGGHFGHQTPSLCASSTEREYFISFCILLPAITV
jgi:hypothetical protein